MPRGGKSEVMIRILFLINFAFVFYIIFIVMDLSSLKYPKLWPILEAGATKRIATTAVGYPKHLITDYSVKPTPVVTSSTQRPGHW